MDTKSRLAEYPGGGQNSDEMSPQERLQRLADAFDAGQDWPDGHILELVAAAQDRPARAEVAPSAETGGNDFGLVAQCSSVSSHCGRCDGGCRGDVASSGPAHVGPGQLARFGRNRKGFNRPRRPSRRRRRRNLSHLKLRPNPTVPKAPPANRAPAHFIPWSPPQNNPVAPVPTLPKPSVDGPAKPTATAGPPADFGSA